MTHDTPPLCTFYDRTIAPDGLYHYQQIMISAPEGCGRRTMAHPPAIGDLIFLYDEIRKCGGQYRIIARDWSHPSYGSAGWPYGQAMPTIGPLLNMIVERAVGPFSDQSPITDEDQQ